MWQCAFCETTNDDGQQRCVACTQIKTEKPPVLKAPSTIDSEYEKDPPLIEPTVKGSSDVGVFIVWALLLFFIIVMALAFGQTQ